TPDLEEAQVSSEVSDLEKMITQNGGSILVPREPKRMHLSYPIDHKHYVYFGVIDFSGPTEIIDMIENRLKLQPNVLRHLIIKKEEGKELRTLGSVRQYRQKEISPKVQRPVEVPKAKTPEQEEKLDQDIKEALEKIS
ncbi:MAG: 30S ribosomal protein S6, partial [Parcubacteria group bacterium]